MIERELASGAAADLGAAEAGGSPGGGGPRRFSRHVIATMGGAGVLPILLVVMVVVFGTIEPRFVTSDNLINVARQSTFLAIVAMGQMLVLLSGGFDLSVGAIIALVSVVAASVMTGVAGDGGDAILAVGLGCGAGLLVGLAAGLANGLGVAVLRVSPFIVTLGSMSVLTGIALVETGGAPITGLPSGFVTTLGTDRILEIPTVVYVTALLIAVMFVVVNRSRFGRYVYAIGGNETAARLSGISVGRHFVGVYVFSGVLAAIAGLLLTARVSAGEPNLGASFMLQSITAAVLGGVSLKGGEGRLGGVLLGALFIAMLSNGMNLIRVSSFYQEIALGLLLILAVVFDRLRDRLRHAD